MRRCAQSEGSSILRLILQSLSSIGIIINLVAHGRWNSMLLSAASGMSLVEALTLRQTNACVNILECDERGDFNIHLLNCAAHLSDGDARELATSTDNG